jgi:hypothetical protein
MEEENYGVVMLSGIDFSKKLIVSLSQQEPTAQLQMVLSNKE